MRGLKFSFILSVILLVSISFVYGSLDVAYNTDLPKVVVYTPDRTDYAYTGANNIFTSNNTFLNVTIINQSILNVNDTIWINGLPIDDIFLKLSGDNANQNINIGVYDFTASNLELNNEGSNTELIIHSGAVNLNSSLIFEEGGLGRWTLLLDGLDNNFYLWNDFRDSPAIKAKLTTNEIYFYNNTHFEGDLLPQTTLAHDIGSGTYRWNVIYGTNLSIDNIQASENIEVLGYVNATNYYGSGADLEDLNVTGTINVSGDFTGYALNTSYLYGALGIGGIDMRGDPWYFGGADLQIAENLIVNGNVSADIITANEFIGTFTGNSSIWNRTGTTITPANAGDSLDMGTGSITTTGTVQAETLNTIKTNLITNGEFDTDLTGWTNASTGLGYLFWDSGGDGGRLGMRGNNGKARTSVTTEIGKQYLIGFDFQSQTNTYFAIHIGSTAGAEDILNIGYSGTNKVGLGLNVYYFIATTTTTHIEFFEYGNNIHYLDDVFILGVNNIEGGIVTDGVKTGGLQVSSAVNLFQGVNVDNLVPGNALTIYREAPEYTRTMAFYIDQDGRPLFDSSTREYYFGAPGNSDTQFKIDVDSGMSTMATSIDGSFRIMPKSYHDEDQVMKFSHHKNPDGIKDWVIFSGWTDLVAGFDLTAIKQSDDTKHYFGTGDDASIYYDAANLIINPKEVGSGQLRVLGDLNVTNNITGNQIYGEMWFHNESVSGNPTIITSQDAWYNVTGFNQTTESGQTLNGFSYSNYELICQVSGLYKVDYSISFGGGLNDEYKTSIGVNGVNKNNTETHRKLGAGGDVGNTGSSGFISLNVNDKITLMILNDDAIANSDIHSANLNLIRIGD